MRFACIFSVSIKNTHHKEQVWMRGSKRTHAPKHAFDKKTHAKKKHKHKHSEPHHAEAVRGRL